MIVRFNHAADRLEFKFEIEVRNELAQKLIDIAARAGKTPIELMAIAIEKLIGDDLFAAVIDEGD